MKEFVATEWDRARTALRTARQLCPSDPDSAASRAYYAAFHALTALFALRGEVFKKHSALRAALHRDLVKTGVLDRERGRDFDFLMDLRETGDYGGGMRVSPDSAESAAAKAEAFVLAVAELHPELRL